MHSKVIFSKQILIRKQWFYPYLGQNPVGNKRLNGRDMTLRIIDCEEYVLRARHILLVLKSVLIDHRSRGCRHRDTEGATVCEGCSLQ